MPANEIDPSAIEPSKLATRMFGTSRRGFDQDEVRAFLRELASVITRLQDDKARLQDEIAGLSRQVTEAETREVVVPDLDEDQLTAALGAETARVLATARHSATEIRTNAEEGAARVEREAADAAAATRAAADEAALATRTAADTYAADTRAGADAAASTTRADADAEAGRLVAEAESVASALRADAEAAAASTTAEAAAAATTLTEEARAEAEATRAEAAAAAEAMQTEAESLLALRTTEADAEAARIGAEAAAVLAAAAVEADAAVEAAKEQGRQLVAEAQQVREQTLRDLARRRKTARLQLEQLRAGRERLLDAFDVVRRSTDEATGELLVAMPEARVAAQDAARRSESEDEATVAELEAEIAAARPPGTPSPAPRLEDVVPAVAADDDADAGEDDLDAGPSTDELEIVSPPRDETIEVDVVMIPTEAAPVVPEPDPVPVVPEHDPVPVVPEPDPVPVVPEPDPVPVVPEPEPGPAPEPAPEAAASSSVDGDGAVVEAAVEGPAEVDDLFARLRAAREGDAEAPAAEEARGEVANGGPASAGTASMGLVSLLERRDGMTDEIEHRLARRLKRVMADEQNAVLDGVRRARKVPLVEDVLPPLEDHLASYASAAVEDLMAAVEAGAEFQGGPAEVPAGVAEEMAQALATELTSVVRPRIERCFEEVDGDEDELTALIRSGYREWKTQQIADLVRHHVLLAFSRGQFSAMPADATLQWVIDDSGAPCPDAEDNTLAGLVVKGEAFPTGHCFPPAHPGCRCLVVASPH